MYLVNYLVIDYLLSSTIKSGAADQIIKIMHRAGWGPDLQLTEELSCPRQEKGFWILQEEPVAPTAQ